MKKVCFDAVVGDRRFEVELSEVSGSVGIVHLYINRFWFGQFGKRAGEWVYLPQRPNELTIDDIQILIRMIEKMATPG
ncbi:hypothetical protein [Chitinophaga ginsengisegetis]|uniref:hypothetical protein n=1 Tax=Chitinophaga ginsengisegetis TaxID=393003 RepID=UPI000DB9FFE0|nr:hypothetical protein [Chitinophaga ginsengisegetis]MDR6565449.1 membrane carboxypeptidase/penicillin-binding protein [Chitinophaga ginsengisegetis]MDR6645177.1 membrane carboxypeptidase/penicillin-binding protein [Chitinophaga ginsengisegetis]MDR6652231.1 membrane carboxypeptidase/penicillin-binding protein [Chitinophaga ginsengisegetis]